MNNDFAGHVLVQFPKPHFRIEWFLGDAILVPLNKSAQQKVIEHLDKILKSQL